MNLSFAVDPQFPIDVADLGKFGTRLGQASPFLAIRSADIFEVAWIYAPQTEHHDETFQFADSVAGEPLLVHCWAGVSRSTGVALSLNVRAMLLNGFSEDQIVKEASEILLEIRPQAAPNPLILEIGLSRILDATAANRLAVSLVNHPGLF